MDDLNAKIKQLQSHIASLESEKAKASEPDPFKASSCAKCGHKINMSFLLPVIKQSGLCPSCYHEK